MNVEPCAGRLADQPPQDIIAAHVAFRAVSDLYYGGIDAVRNLLIHLRIEYPDDKELARVLYRVDLEIYPARAHLGPLAEFLDKLLAGYVPAGKGEL